MEKLDELTYVDRAERVIKSLQAPNRRGEMEIKLSTSKIRNLLGMISEIYNEAVHETNTSLKEEIQGKIQYLRLRFVYEAGREKTVKEFVEKAEILDCLNQIGKSRASFLLFCKYMEALVAYHKFYGGRDN